MVGTSSVKLEYAQKIAYFDERLQLYRQTIGSWPPSFVSREQERETRFLWQTDYKHAASLLHEHPQDLDIKLVVAELLRMGDNLDIPDAAEKAESLLNAIFEVDANHLQAMICRASMYVCLKQNRMPEAEQLFTRAKDITYPYVPAEIYQGLAYACLYQSKSVEAVSSFEQYLKLVTADQKVKDLLARIKAEEKTRDKLPATSSGPKDKGSQDSPLFQPIKPWWKLW